MIGLAGPRARMPDRQVLSVAKELRRTQGPRQEQDLPITNDAPDGTADTYAYEGYHVQGFLHFEQFEREGLTTLDVVVLKYRSCLEAFENPLTRDVRKSTWR